MIGERKDVYEPATEVKSNLAAWLEGISPKPAFALVFSLSLILRLIALAVAFHQPLVSDSTDYREMAVLLAGGTGFLPYWPPGLPLYLSIFIALGLGDGVLRAAMLLWWVLFCWGMYRLAVSERMEKMAALVLLVFAIAPAEIHFSVEPMTQMPAAALLLLALSAAVRCAQGAGWGEYLLLGGSLGYLCLVRPSVIPLLVVLPVLVFVRRRHLPGFLAAVLLGGVMIFGWMVKAHQLSGVWTINTANGVNLYYGNNPWTPTYRSWYFGSHAKLGSDEILLFPEYKATLEEIAELPAEKRSAKYSQLAVDYVVHHPGVFIVRTLNRIRCYWGFDTFTAANIRGRNWLQRLFIPVMVLDALCYLAIAGFAVFWIEIGRAHV